MKNSSDTIGNRNRNLPTCSTVLQPTGPPRAPTSECTSDKSEVLIYQVKHTVTTLPTERNVYLPEFRKLSAMTDIRKESTSKTH
jgi:hypothetical protein